jgi:hypothetical protein
MGSTIARRGQPSPAHNYLILMTCQAQLLQREPGKQFALAEIDLQVALEDIAIEISNSQLRQIIGLAERLQTYTRKLKEANRATLSPEAAKANREFFNRVFPLYYEGWGKNVSAEDLGRLEEVLEKTEVEVFAKDIQLFLQGRERDRIIKERKEKNKGWWFGKTKELSEQELAEVEAYLTANFSQEVRLVKRPEDYHYIRVGLKLHRFEVRIANTMAIIREGIQTTAEELSVQFLLREGGYGLEASLEDLSVSMFKQVGV